MKTATIDMITNAQGDGTNDTFRLSNFNPISLSDSPCVRQTVSLTANTFNTFTVPQSSAGTYAKYCLVLPTGTSTVSKNFGGNIVTTNQAILLPCSSSLALGCTPNGAEVLELAWY